jgi:tryptophan synthase alpha subunit
MSNTNGIQGAFSKTEKENRGAFIPYLTAGYPDPDTFLEIAQTLADKGADIIEIGLPFSDPLADGPVIQKSSKSALDIGITPDRVLELAAQVSERVSTPLVIMSYYNPILQMGHETFAKRAHEAGVSGVIIPDLTPEEAEDWLAAAGEYSLDTIFMIAPTTPLARKKGDSKNRQRIRVLRIPHRCNRSRLGRVRRTDERHSRPQGSDVPARGRWLRRKRAGTSRASVQSGRRRDRGHGLDSGNHE